MAQISVVQRIASVAPEVHLDATGTAGVMMIALPCLTLLLAWSRDSDRWLRMFRRAWCTTRPAQSVANTMISLDKEPIKSVSSVAPRPHSLAAQDVTLSR